MDNALAVHQDVIHAEQHYRKPGNEEIEEPGRKKSTIDMMTFGEYLWIRSDKGHHRQVNTEPPTMEARTSI